MNVGRSSHWHHLCFISLRTPIPRPPSILYINITFLVTLTTSYRILSATLFFHQANWYYATLSSFHGDNYIREFHVKKAQSYRMILFTNENTKNSPNHFPPQVQPRIPQVGLAPLVPQVVSQVKYAKSERRLQLSCPPHLNFSACHLNNPLR